jgi:hypothetical protein
MAIMNISYYTIMDENNTDKCPVGQTQNLIHVRVPSDNALHSDHLRIKYRLIKHCFNMLNIQSISSPTPNH